MLTFGASELWLILVVVLVLFGRKRFPQLGRNLAKAAAEFKSGLQDSRPAASKRRKKAAMHEKQPASHGKQPASRGKQTDSRGKQPQSQQGSLRPLVLLEAPETRGDRAGRPDQAASGEGKGS